MKRILQANSFVLHQELTKLSQSLPTQESPCMKLIAHSLSRTFGRKMVLSLLVASPEKDLKAWLWDPEIHGSQETSLQLSGFVRVFGSLDPARREIHHREFYDALQHKHF